MALFPLIWLGVTVIAIILLFVLRPNRHITWLVLIALLVSFAGWAALPDNPGVKVDFNNDGTPEINMPIAIREGLDLAGGLQILLQADLPEGQQLKTGSMDEARRIVLERIDTLGALNPVVQQRGDNRLIVEIPGYQDPKAATDLIRETALLEFVECPADVPIQTMDNQPIRTDYKAQLAAPGQGAITGTPVPSATPSVTPTPEATATPQSTGTPAAQPGIAPTAPATPEPPLCHTVMTGDILADAQPGRLQTGQYVVNFTLTPKGAQEFGTYTASHIGQPLAMVLDGTVLSAPTIQSAITSSGQISGRFTLDSATKLARQLRYGALPVGLKVESSSSIGPTLGQISVQKSVTAGIIGIVVVLLFMLTYYRLPGFAAALALLAFAVLNLALYKIIPVTMTLPAIIGFLISIGTAVDGNVLIFERMKEEIRRGKHLDSAIDTGFERAWTSIRDSNLSSIIISLILIIFGSSFGAGTVTGFALTLLIGLIINLFTAVIVTRTFLHFLVLIFGEERLTGLHWLMGI